MKYKDKIRKAEATVDLLKTGLAMDQVKQNLIQEGFDERNIDAILKTTQTLIYEDYVDQVKEHLIKRELEYHLDNFDLVDSFTFEKIQYSAIDKINIRTNTLVDKMLEQDMSKEEIWDAIENPFYSEEMLDKQIDKYEYYNKPAGGMSQKSLLAIGAALIVLGILLSFVLSQDNTTHLFYGLIIAGFLVIVNSSRSQSDVDNKMKLGHRPFQSSYKDKR